MFRFHLLVVLASIGVLGLVTSARAADAPSIKVSTSSDATMYQQVVDKGINYLMNKGQQPDGSFGKDVGPGVAAICTTALLKHGRSPDDPAVARSLKYLSSFVHDDGGIYSPDSPVKNYETSLAIQCFAAANGDGRYKSLLAKAEKFIKGIQYANEPTDFNYGGSGYEPKKRRADLSNTSFLLDALQATGAGADDEAVKRALVFVSRCQNLETENNSTPFAAKTNDGGFYYTPAAGGVSEAGKSENGGLRSYGSMTYAGFKSMIFAGLKPDDPRVKAAIGWIKSHYTLSANPGMGESKESKAQDGLYYYYHTFAKALSAAGWTEVEDDNGVKHNWRHDLITALAQRQLPDGSWVNSDPRFLEGNTNLVTAYALLALSYAQPGK
jgi:squalene-hopene/tetraprenyl-beta-curcumene cyclase